MKTVLIKAVFIGACLSIASGCGDSLRDSRIDSSRVCSFAGAAFKENGFDNLLLELEREFGIPKKKMRITSSGVFVPMKKRFVEESGYFVARPGINFASPHTDPSFELLKECVYRYEIKG